MRKQGAATQLPANRVAEWLLRSLETIGEMERTTSSAAKTKDRARTAKLLHDYIESQWRPKTNIDLASAAQCSPGTITSLVRDGFDIRNKSAAKICQVLGIDFRSLCQKHEVRPIVQPNPTTKGAKKSPLVDAAEQLIGTDQERLALEYLQFALAKAKR